MNQQDYFKNLQIRSENKINLIRSEFNKLIEKDEDSSIFITGSLGRLECRESSDLDLFLFSNKSDSVKTKTYLRYAAFECQKTLKFAPLTENFLDVHNPDAVSKSIGDAEDNFSNSLTARMLLLFESQWAYNEELFNQIKQKVVDQYFRDSDNSEFRPIFLLNDIIRYWRVMTLTYESSRTKYFEEKSRDEKFKQKKKNKKLRFNRIWLCYSAILPLISRDTWNKEDFHETFKHTPYQRLSSLTNNSELFNVACDNYMNFLIENDKLNSLPENDKWKELNSYAQSFRTAIKKMVYEHGTEKMRSYLLI